MRAAVIEQFGGDVRMADVPAREPGPGEALVEVVACGVGLTLEIGRSGAFGGSVPRVLGHEFSGYVRTVGPGVHGWRPGDRVTASFYLFCNQCDFCAAGRETLCTDLRGVVGLAIDGALADYVTLPAHNLVRVPAGVELETAGVTADAIATPYHVLTKRAPVVPGQRVAVVGAGGGVGVHMVQMAKAFGAVVVAIERDPAKLARLPELGVDACVDAAGDDWAEAAVEAAGGQIDTVVDTVASDVTLRNGFAAVGRAGTLVVLGIRPGSRIELDPLRLASDEIFVTGTRYATRTEIARSLELVRQGRVRPVIGARFALERTPEAFAAIQRNEVFGRVLVECREDK